MKDEHQATPKNPGHPSETVIHHPEKDMTELGRLVKRAIDKGPAFWGFLAAGVALVVGLVMVIIRLTAPDPSEARAWTELAVVDSDPSSMFGLDMGGSSGPSPAQRRLEIADRYESSRAGQWAKLQAASILLNEGSSELPTASREDAKGKLMEAAELFQEVEDATQDSTLKRLATLGQARAEEARLGFDLEDPERGKIDRAIELYESVAERWPDTPEGNSASKLARRLLRPESKRFYDSLARFDPAAAPVAPSIPGLDFPLGPGEGRTLDDLLGPGFDFGGVGSFGSGMGTGTGAGTSEESSPLTDDLGIPALSPDDDSEMPAPVPIDPSAESLPGSGTEAMPIVPPTEPDSSPSLPAMPFGQPSTQPRPEPEPTPEPTPEPQPTPDAEPAPSPSPSLPSNPFGGGTETPKAETSEPAPSNPDLPSSLFPSRPQD